MTKTGCNCKQCIYCDKYKENYNDYNGKIICSQCSTDDYNNKCPICNNAVYTSNPIKSAKTHEECIAKMNLSSLVNPVIEWNTQIRSW